MLITKKLNYLSNNITRWLTLIGVVVVPNIGDGPQTAQIMYERGYPKVD